jgi:hypothetical protein
MAAIAIMIAVVAGVDGKVTADFKVRTAAMVDPNAVLVIAPGAVLDALGFAFLVHHLNATGGVDGANVTVHIIGIARHAQRRLRYWRGRDRFASWSGCQN